MKQLAIIIALLATALTASGQSIRFDKTTHNFGTIEEAGGRISHTFTYTNTSSEPIVIVDVVVSCGCTTPHFSREPLSAGASERMIIEFDPYNRPGRIDKQIIVLTNHGNYTLSIDGVVNARPRSLVERYPFVIDGGARLDGLGHFSMQVPIGGQQSVDIGVANGGVAIPVTVSIDKSQLPSGVTATIDQQFLAANDEAKLTIHVRGEKYGTFSHRIPLLINGQQTAETITVAGAVVDNFAAMTDEQLIRAARASFSTFYYRFGSVKSGVRHKAVIEITNTGKSPLIIRGIEGSAQIEAKIDRTTVAPSAVAKLTVNYYQARKGYDSGWIRLITNDARNPTPEIRFVATVE